MRVHCRTMAPSVWFFNFCLFWKFASNTDLSSKAEVEFPCKCFLHASLLLGVECSKHTAGNFLECKKLRDKTQKIVPNYVYSVTIAGLELHEIPERICDLVYDPENPRPYLIQLIKNDLSKMILSDIPLNCTKNALHITIQENHIPRIGADTFVGSGYTNLVRLRFQSCEIEFVDGNTFNWDSLSRVKEIGLPHNQIRYIYPDTFKWSILKKLKVVDLSFNFIKQNDLSTFVSLSIATVNLTSNCITTLGHSMDSFFLEKGKTTLMRLDLSINKINSLSPTKEWMSYRLYNKQRENPFASKVFLSGNWKASDLIAVNDDISHLNKTSFYRLAVINLYVQIRVDCDCSMLEYFNYAKSLKDALPLTLQEYYQVMLLKCGRPVELAGLSLDTLQDTDLRCEFGGKVCSDEPNCSCTYIPANGTLRLNCKNANLERLPVLHSNASSLELYMSNNSITNIATGNNVLESTVLLDLSYNNIHTLPMDTFYKLTKLEVLNVANNVLSKIDIPLVKNLHHLQIAQLGGNPYICDCAGLETKMILIQLGEKLNDQNNVKCSSPSSVVGKKVMEVADDAFGCPSTNWKLLTAVSVCLMTLIIVLMISSYAFRKYIRFLLFTQFGWRIGKQLYRGNKEFDAFIAYSSLDADWVYANLLVPLEKKNPPRKICVHSRDFRLGVPIMQNLAYAIQSSACAIMVLSENFLRSEWCQQEFRLAHYEALQENDSHYKVIVVLLELLPDALLTGELRLYLKTNTYIDGADCNLIPRVDLELPAPTHTLNVEDIPSSGSDTEPLLTHDS